MKVCEKSSKLQLVLLLLMPMSALAQTGANVDSYPGTLNGMAAKESVKDQPAAEKNDYRFIGEQRQFPQFGQVRGSQNPWSYRQSQPMQQQSAPVNLQNPWQVDGFTPPVSMPNPEISSLGRSDASFSDWDRANSQSNFPSYGFDRGYSASQPGFRRSFPTSTWPNSSFGDSLGFPMFPMDFF